MWQQLFYDFMYRFRQPPWDTGVTPPEVVELIKSNQVHGRALDLGCGTGTNSIYLARHGLSVVGLDFAPKAIATARAKAKRAQVNVDFRVADVTRLDTLRLREPFDLVLDIGCFHSIPAASRTRYAEGVAGLTCSGSIYMLYAFSPHPPEQKGHLIPARNVGLTEKEIRSLLTPHFALTRLERGSDHDERASAWYWFRRQ